MRTVGETRGGSVTISESIRSHAGLISRGEVSPLRGVPFHGAADAPITRRVLAGGDLFPEAEKRVAIFIDEHKTGNTVGFEKLRKGSHHAKACETIRSVEIIVPHVPTLANASRARLGQQMGLVALKRAKRA